MMDIRRPKAPPPRNRLPNSEEMERLAYSASDDPSKRIIRAFHAFRFAIETAMRAGEIVGLTRDCVIVGEGIETTLAALAALWRKGRRHWSAEAALSLGALAGPADPTGRGPENGANGEALPSAIPAQSTSPGWLPPLIGDQKPRRLLILGEGSSRCPASAERHGRRAYSKLKPLAVRTMLRVPRGQWGADLDFADLAQLGEI